MLTKSDFLQKNSILILNVSRWLLMLGLAVSAYLLLLAWQNDYGDANNLSPNALPSKTSSATDFPNVKLPSTANKTDDVPALNPAIAQHLSANESTDALIEVQTDTLQVKIDLRGGDVVHAALLTYPVSLDQSSPFILLKNNQGVYVAQSGMIGLSGQDFDQPNRPLYQAKQTQYRMQGNLLEVPLTLSLDNGLQVTKLYRFLQGEHVIEVVYQLKNAGNSAWQGSFFGQLKRDNAIDTNAKFSGFSLPTYLGAAYWKPDQTYNKLPFDKIADAGDKLVLDETIPGGWLAIVQHYFIAAWIPTAGTDYHYTARTNKQGENIIGFTAPLVTISSGQSQEIGAKLYVGPKLHDNLASLAPGLDLAIDYGLLFFISYFLVRVLIVLHSVLGNWGWAIVLLTCLVKILFFYPSAISYRSMAQMRLVQPKMVKLKEQFGEDKQRFSQEMIKLYKQEKINPVSGCLPMLLQMPVFFALYWALMESVQLRHAPFILWIRDLSAMDPYFVLPLFMGVTMFLQMRLNPAPTDPMQAKVMQFMPIMFTALFLFFPSGLVLYWITNNVLSIAQQWIITHRLSKA
jgi:YidC/Oxa1 family membrane protein insertase